MQLPPTGITTSTSSSSARTSPPPASQYFTSADGRDHHRHPRRGQRPADRAGRAVALLTGAQLVPQGQHERRGGGRQNTFADIAEGRIEVDGQFTVLFADATSATTS
jgi:hypothetical protein